MNWKKILWNSLVLPFMAAGLIACSNKPGAEAAADSCSFFCSLLSLSSRLRLTGVREFK